MPSHETTDILIKYEGKAFTKEMTSRILRHFGVRDYFYNNIYNYSYN